MKERNVPLLVVGLIFLGLSPFALVGGSAMVAEGKGDDKDIGVALQVIGGTTFGFGLAGTLAGIVPVNVESDAAFAEPAGAAALGPLSFGGSF